MPPTFDVECQSLNESIAGLFASVIVEANRVNQNNENPVIDYLQFDIQDHRNHLQPSVFKSGVRKSFHWDSASPARAGWATHNIPVSQPNCR